MDFYGKGEGRGPDTQELELRNAHEYWAGGHPKTAFTPILRQYVQQVMTGKDCHQSWKRVDNDLSEKSRECDRYLAGKLCVLW